MERKGSEHDGIRENSTPRRTGEVIGQGDRIRPLRALRTGLAGLAVVSALVGVSWAQTMNPMVVPYQEPRAAAPGMAYPEGYILIHHQGICSQGCERSRLACMSRARGDSWMETVCRQAASECIKWCNEFGW